MAEAEKKSPEGISILGCGWLGLPLAQELLARGHPVKGSRRSQEGLTELKKAGIEGHQLIADPASSILPKAFFDSEVLLIDIPPGRKDPNGAAAYPEKIRTILEQAAKGKVQKLLFVSSSSVHPETNDRIPSGAEGRSKSGNGPVLIQAEDLVRSFYPENSTIVRFGGLIGPGRHPVRYLSGRRSSRNGDAPVNMIHQADAVGAILKILDKGLWGYRFDVCAPEHPSRKAFYGKAARDLDIQAPEFDPEAPLRFKRIDPSFFQEISGFRFRYPNPLHMTTE
jgi:nucleoside-diphosphate-sugar epimerase